MWRSRSAIGSGRCVLPPERHITSDKFDTENKMLHVEKIALVQ
jgi:hypothetical protein